MVFLWKFPIPEWISRMHSAMVRMSRWQLGIPKTSCAAGTLAASLTILEETLLVEATFWWENSMISWKEWQKNGQKLCFYPNWNVEIPWFLLQPILEPPGSPRPPRCSLPSVRVRHQRLGAWVKIYRKTPYFMGKSMVSSFDFPLNQSVAITGPARSYDFCLGTKENDLIN